MTKLIGPKDLERLVQSSQALRDAEAETTRCREAFVELRSDANKEAWVEAIRAEKRAHDTWWETHRDYFQEL